MPQPTADSNLIGASHGYILRAHMNKRTLLNNVMKERRRRRILSLVFVIVVCGVYPPLPHQNCYLVELFVKYLSQTSNGLAK